MKQIIFADNVSELAVQKARERISLEEMNCVVLRMQIFEVFQGCAPTAILGQPAFPIEVMSQIYFLSLWRDRWDQAMVEALHGMPWVFWFIGMDSGTACSPDEFTILSFRDFLEEFRLAEAILAAVTAMPQSKVLSPKSGTAKGETLVAAPSVNKSSGSRRELQMGQAKKGSEYCCGMKEYINVIVERLMNGTLVTVPVNTKESTDTRHLLYGEDLNECSDSSFRGIKTRKTAKTLQRTWQVGSKACTRRAPNFKRPICSIESLTRKAMQEAPPLLDLRFQNSISVRFNQTSI